MTVLVLTCEEDVTADLVVAKLGDKVVRIDPGHFPSRIKLTATWQGGRLSGGIDTGMRYVRLKDIESVWVRRPGKPGTPGGPQEKWAGHECTHALMGALRALPSVRWMNHPDTQEKARYKIHQLAVAHQSGLHSPATLVTTESRDASAYVRGMGNVVCKTVSGRQPDDPPVALPTTRIPPDSDLSGVDGFPTCFQRAVDKAADIRLTAIGRKLFCARAAGGSPDCRYDPQTRWQPASIPSGIAPKVLRVMEEFGLTYGAFDFAEDNDGRWWFLEVNPAGQFAFIETEAQLPLSQAITDWLLGA